MILNPLEQTFLTELANKNNLTFEEALEHLVSPKNRKDDFQIECVIDNQSISKLNLGVQTIHGLNGINNKYYGYTKFNHLPSFIHLPHVKILDIFGSCNLPINVKICGESLNEINIHGQDNLMSLVLEGSTKKITCFGNKKMDLLDISKLLNLREIELYEVPKLKFKIKDIQIFTVEGLTRLKRRILQTQTEVANSNDLSFIADSFSQHPKWDSSISAAIVNHINCSKELMEEIYWELVQKVYPHYPSKNKCITIEEKKIYSTLTLIEKKDWGGQSKNKINLKLEVNTWAKIPSISITQYSGVTLTGNVIKGKTVKKKKLQPLKKALNESNNRISNM